MKRHTAEEYLELLSSLMPVGKAWNRDPLSRMYQFLYGKAEELARIEARIIDLIETERDTRLTTELLSDFETEFGLPDDCSDLAPTVDQRRQELHAKYLSLGGQWKQYFIDMLEALGVEAKIIEYVDERFHFSVVGKTQEIEFFICGSSVCGDFLSLVTPGAILECFIEKFKPAHTVADYKYTGYGFSAGFSAGFNSGNQVTLMYLQGGFSRGFNIGFRVYYGGGFRHSAFGKGFSRPVVPAYTFSYGGGFTPGYSSGFKKPNILGW